MYRARAALRRPSLLASPSGVLDTDYRAIRSRIQYLRFSLGYLGNDVQRIWQRHLKVAAHDSCSARRATKPGPGADGQDPLFRHIRLNVATIQCGLSAV